MARADSSEKSLPRAPGEYFILVSSALGVSMTVVIWSKAVRYGSKICEA